MFLWSFWYKSNYHLQLGLAGRLLALSQLDRAYVSWTGLSESIARKTALCPNPRFERPVESNTRPLSLVSWESLVLSLRWRMDVSTPQWGVPACSITEQIDSSWLVRRVMKLAPWGANLTCVIKNSETALFRALRALGFWLQNYRICFCRSHAEAEPSAPCKLTTVYLKSSLPYFTVY